MINRIYFAVFEMHNFELFFNYEAFELSNIRDKAFEYEGNLLFVV